jgi:hypothetical protein
MDHVRETNCPTSVHWCSELEGTYIDECPWLSKDKWERIKDRESFTHFRYTTEFFRGKLGASFARLLAVSSMIAIR